MPHFSQAAAYSDAALLLAAQLGNRPAQNELFGRFKSLIAKTIFLARPAGRYDFIEDVLGETFRMLLAPKTKFQSARGNAKKYIFGRVRNAIRIVERQRRPICLNLTRRPVADNDELAANDAGIVSNNTFGLRSQSLLDTNIDDREAVAVALKGETELGIAIAYLHLVEDTPVTAIALRLKMDRFAVARRLKAVCRDANKRLRIAGIA